MNLVSALPNGVKMLQVRAHGSCSRTETIKEFIPGVEQIYLFYLCIACMSIINPNCAS